MNVAVLCEFSGVVRDAFIARGHRAVSCDLLPTEVPGPHLVGDCLSYDWRDFDLVVCHPPCTYLTRAGARWWKGREREQDEALEFVRALLALPVPRIALENPPGRIGTVIRKCDQTVQPWEHGHGETKATSLWLKGLTLLVPSNVVSGREPRVHYAAPGPDRWKNRIRTLPGIAAAMATQWGVLPTTR